MLRRAADERRTDRSDTPVAVRPYDGGRRTVGRAAQGKGVIHVQPDGGRGADTVVAVAVAGVENIGRV